MKKELEKKKKGVSLGEKVSDILFYKSLALISKNYRLYTQREALYQKIKNKELKNLSEKEVNLLLGSIQPKPLSLKPKKLSLKKHNNFISITKSIKVYIHE